LDEKCKKLEETIQRVPPNTNTRKQANKEWFDEECAKVNEENNPSRKRAYKLARTKESCLLKKGKAARRRGFNRD
jgi:hypothetical protein